MAGAPQRQPGVEWCVCVATCTQVTGQKGAFQRQRPPSAASSWLCS